MAGRSYPPGTVLAGACAAQAAVSFVAFGLPAVGPELRHAYGLTLPELGAILTAIFLGSGVGLVGAGIAVDRFGSSRTMLAGAALGSAGLAGAGFAGSKHVLFAALLVSGLGSAVVPIAGAGALFRVYPAARRGWALGVRQMAVPLGGTVAALVLPGLESAGGVRLPLLAGAAAVGLTGIAFAAVSGGERLRRAETKRAFRRIVRAPGMGRLLLVASLYIVVLQGVLVYSVPAVRAAGFSSFSASATFFAINVTAMAARLVWGRLADRAAGTRRSRTLVQIGLVASVGGVLFTLALHTGAVAVVATAILFGFGALGWNAVVYVSAGERASPELAGRSVALAATVVFLLSAAATPPLGALAEHAGWDAFWLTCTALALAGAAVAASLAKAWSAERGEVGS
jgi:MFS family permease